MKTLTYAITLIKIQLIKKSCTSDLYIFINISPNREGTLEPKGLSVVCPSPVVKDLDLKSVVPRPRMFA